MSRHGEMFQVDDRNTLYPYPLHLKSPAEASATQFRAPSLRNRGCAGWELFGRAFDFGVLFPHLTYYNERDPEERDFPSTFPAHGSALLAGSWEADFGRAKKVDAITTALTGFLLSDMLVDDLYDNSNEIQNCNTTRHRKPLNPPRFFRIF
jgi:hypothetical protein